jgi:hypothetical protein
VPYRQWSRGSGPRLSTVLLALYGAGLVTAVVALRRGFVGNRGAGAATLAVVGEALVAVHKCVPARVRILPLNRERADTRPSSPFPLADEHNAERRNLEQTIFISSLK